MKLDGYKDITQLNKKQTILVDMDQVLNNLNVEWVRLYNEKYNDNLLYQNITDWIVYDFFKNCTHEQVWELLETPTLFSKMVKPLEDSVKVTEILSKFFELYIVTSCSHPNIILEKFEFVETHFPHIHRSDIVTCKNKCLIKGDYMIDDYVENLRCFDGKGLLLNTSYNLNVNLPDNTIRVTSWDDILMYFAIQNKELMNYLVKDMFECGESYIEKFDIKTVAGIKNYLNLK